MERHALGSGIEVVHAALEEGVVIIVVVEDDVACFEIYGLLAGYVV